MLRRIGLGIFVMAISFLSNSIVEVVGQVENGNVTFMFSASAEDGDNFPISYWWTWINNIIHGTGFMVTLYSSLEFFIAQTPWQMKGLIVSIFLVAFAIMCIAGGIFAQIFISFPFHLFPSCGFYYYMTFCVIMFVILLLFVLVSKWYTLRKRDDIVPYHRLAEDYFEKNYLLEHQYTKKYFSVNVSD